MSISIRILADNFASCDFTAEHGLSFLIQDNDFSMLFDTGQGEAVFANASKLGIDFSDIKALVLSHGHYDHTGGMAELKRLNSNLNIFFHPSATVRRFSVHPGLPVKDISMPCATISALRKHPKKLIHHVTAPAEIFHGVKLTGEIPRVNKLEDTGGPFFLDLAGTAPDSIPDDMALWIETSKGLVIVLGCCHSGLINTVEYVKRISGMDKIHGIIGGMHLLHAGTERIDCTCRKLQEWSPEFIAPCHCTGENAVKAIAACLPDRIITAQVGSCITF